MASEVRVTLVGDGDQLEKTLQAGGKRADEFRRAIELSGRSLAEFKADATAAGRSADDMAREILALDRAASALDLTYDGLRGESDRLGMSMQDTADKIRSQRESFDRAAEGADNLDTKMMGARDGLTGVQDSMTGVADIARGDLGTGILALGFGLGDLGSSATNTVVPALKSMNAALGTTRTAMLGALGVAGLIIAGFLLFKDSNEKVEESIEDVNEDLKVFIQTGQAVGALGRNLGKINLKEFESSVSSLGYRAGRTFEEMDKLRNLQEGQSAKNWAVEIDQGRAALENLDQAMKLAIESGATWDQAMRLATETLGEENAQLALNYGFLDDSQQASIDVADRQRAMDSAIRGAATATEIQNQKFMEATRSAQEFYGFLKSQTDPLFRYTQAKQGYAEAQKGITEAEKEYGRNSPQYQEAILAAAQANIDLDDATVAAANSLTVEMIDSMDLTAQEAIALKRELGLVNEAADKLDGKRIDINMQINITGAQAAAAAADAAGDHETAREFRRTYKYHSGGVVQGPRGKEVLAILQAGEGVVSLDEMDRASRNSGTGSPSIGGGSTFNITVNGSQFRDGTDFMTWLDSLKNNRRRGLGVA